MNDLRIEAAQNGYILRWDEWEDGDEGTGLRTHIDVIQEDELDTLKAGEELLWQVMDFYGFGGSKHDAERIRIVRVKRDAPEPE